MNKADEVCIHYSNSNTCEYLSITIIDEYVKQICKVMEMAKTCPFSSNAMEELYCVKKSQ